MKEDFDLMQPKGKHVFIRGHKLCKITTILGDLYNLIIVVNNKNEVFFFLIELQLFHKWKCRKRKYMAKHLHMSKILILTQNFNFKLL